MDKPFTMHPPPGIPVPEHKPLIIPPFSGLRPHTPTRKLHKLPRSATEVKLKQLMWTAPSDEGVDRLVWTLSQSFIRQYTVLMLMLYLYVASGSYISPTIWSPNCSERSRFSMEKSKNDLIAHKSKPISRLFRVNVQPFFSIDG